MSNEWQSGTIAPTHRDFVERSLMTGTPIGRAKYLLGGQIWVIEAPDEVSLYCESKYQAWNGDLWQWRDINPRPYAPPIPWAKASY